VSAKLPKNEDSKKEKKRRMRYVFYLKCCGMLLLRTEFVNYFHQECFYRGFRLNQKGPEIISPGLFD